MLALSIILPVLLSINIAFLKGLRYLSSKVKLEEFLEVIHLNTGEMVIIIMISMEKMKKLGYFLLTKRKS